VCDCKNKPVYRPTTKFDQGNEGSECACVQLSVRPICTRPLCVCACVYIVVRLFVNRTCPVHDVEYDNS